MAVFVDVSSNNGNPNLAAYRADGHTDLVLKATEGTGYAWDQMPALARTWHSYGPNYRVGYYHWLYGTISGLSQYLWFWAHIGPVFRAGDWMMTDFEDVDPRRWVTDAEHLAVLKQFDTECAKHGWVEDYAPDWYLANLPQCVAWLSANQRPVHASDYTNSPPGNRYGLNHVAHQFTDRANVPGWAGPVDCNRWLTAAGESASSAGAIQISGDDTLSDAQVTAIVSQLTAHIDGKLNGTLARVAEDDPIIVGLHAYIRDCVLALAGQDAALPDGTKITSVGRLWQLIEPQLAAINAKQAAIEAALEKAGVAVNPTPPIDLAAVTAAAEAGASKALNGATVTIHGGTA